MEDTVFWSATAHWMSLEERILAAEAGKFDEISAFPTDVPSPPIGDDSLKDINEVATANDVSVSILDPFAQWLPGKAPQDGGDFEHRDWFAFDEKSFFQIGEALDVDSISVVERFTDGVDEAAAAEHFGQLCDRAVEKDWRVHLEFMPFTEIPDLETAWEIVRRADRPNGGLLFDTWHYYRGTPDDELLRTIPGEKIFRVQISDTEPPTGELREDAIRHRQFPGKGTLDLGHVLGILSDIGGLNSVGVEVFSVEEQGSSPREIGERAGRTLRNVLSEV